MYCVLMGPFLPYPHHCFGIRVLSFLVVFGLSQNAGVEFPPREENSVPFFTPPQTQPILNQPAATYEDAAIHASLESDVSGLRYFFRIVFCVCL